MAQRIVVGVDVLPNGIIRADVSGAANRKIPLTALGDGRTPADYVKEQQTINYLDTLKDKANSQIVQGVSLYPEAMEGGAYPAPWKKVLHGIETDILNSQQQFLNRTTWTKVARGTPLDQPKEYNQIFWESGLGYQVFVANPSRVTTIKTFGSYIDPLEKQNADVTWPDAGGTIELTPNFMELMGFGPSQVVATTRPGGRFDYQLTVACGDACRPDPHCQFGHGGGANDPNMNLFKGNASKAHALASKNKGQAEKIKLLVVKEWGDKLQAIIYFLYTHVGKGGGDTPTIITCDMVVMMFCVMLQVPCIYTGKESHYFPKPAGQDGKYYSIVEYKPSKNPVSDARKRYNYTLKQIMTENKRYISGLRSLAKNPDTGVYLGGDLETFSGAFWKAMADDAQAIETALERAMQVRRMQVPGETVADYNNKIDEMKLKYLLNPVVRSSATNKRNKIKAPTEAQFMRSRLTMSMGQYHTISREQNHGALQKVLRKIPGVDAARQAGRPFYESARIITGSGMAGGGRRGGRYMQRQRGGAPIPVEAQMRDYPPFNDEVAPYYTDLASDGLPDKFDEELPGFVDPSVANTPEAQIVGGAVFEPSEPAPGQTAEFDMQAVFDSSLEDSVEKYVAAANEQHPGISNYGYNLHMTFESLLVYEAAYLDQAPVTITPEDLEVFQQHYMPDLFADELPRVEAPAAAAGMREGRGVGVRPRVFRTLSASSREATLSPPIPDDPGSPLAGPGALVSRWSAPRGRSGIRAMSPGIEGRQSVSIEAKRSGLFRQREEREPEERKEVRRSENLTRRSSKRDAWKRAKRNMDRPASPGLLGLLGLGGGKRRRRTQRRSKTKRTGKKGRTTTAHRRTHRKTRKQEKRR